MPGAGAPEEDAVIDGWTCCPGCGLHLPAEVIAGDGRVNASAECLRVYAEVAGFASQHLPLLQLNQLTVDAYGAQHGGGGAPSIRLAYSLVGLHLAVDRGLTGDAVRVAHQRMGKPDRDWPRFEPPGDVGCLTILTVAEEGLMVEAVAGHQGAALRWAADVWHSWHQQHDLVADLTRQLLPDLARSR